MKNKTNESKKEDIFDELLRLMKSYPFLNGILKKFSVFSILIGAISFFVYGFIFGLLGLVLGIIAKKDNQRMAIAGIILCILGIGLPLIYLISQDISTGNYKNLIRVIIITIFLSMLKLAGYPLYQKDNEDNKEKNL